MKQSDTQFKFECDKNLKSGFLKTCKDNDTSGARELRAFMRSYIQKNGQTKLI